MKKLLLSFVVLPGAVATAQVGINTEEPQAMLDISAKDNQKGDLRIQDVEMKEKTDWLLIWDEKDQKVKRTSLSDLKWDMIVDKVKINYIRGKHPDKADEIINKIKQCAPENINFDKLFGISGKHDFVYCATTVSEDGYSRTWLNLNLGAEYANINSPDFDPTVNKTGTDAHNEAKTYGSLYQWQRASDGHEFRDSSPLFIESPLPSWTYTVEDMEGRFLGGQSSWVDIDGDKNVSDSDLVLWQAGGRNNPCPFGFHVPTEQEWGEFHQAVTGSKFSLGNTDNSVSTNQMFTQKMLPNLATAGYRVYRSDPTLPIIKDRGSYWSSFAENIRASVYSMTFISEQSSIASFSNFTAEGASVRCIKDY
ncbi:fibrobacter succinogenes major paralogous domain [Candidatus Ornithobacterium hominis]|uniref:Fibrobacter succinogenes major paralogous domain n=1 Tax=Candidatus Ornithobacterium hominis TaxID=2497989 RepID=A0A383U3E3_9FLAO|nr:FISUMP domain-containing protein [Candidatus Ornithobacterium hominis]MCT7904660.1 hypothetical protein [Candidatus Ornithobacterium hominis]SZD73998.1 fibrobacter succinogenes major paralogous domain [Candidatus Ornithobacterium hominis]